MRKLFLIPVLALSSCAFGGSSPLFMNVDQPGPPEYKAGWKDGCQSGLATYGSVFYKAQYSFYQNYSMMNNPAYVAAWHESFDYCRHYNLKWFTQDN